MRLTLLYPWALETLEVLGPHFLVVCVCVTERGGKRLGLRGAKVGEVVRIFTNKTFCFNIMLLTQS